VGDWSKVALKWAEIVRKTVDKLPLDKLTAIQAVGTLFGVAVLALGAISIPALGPPWGFWAFIIAALLAFVIFLLLFFFNPRRR
jgi:hypothetical protein